MKLLFVAPYPTSALHIHLSANYRITLCPDKRSALAIAEALAPSIILIETHLPDGDGFSLAHHLASLPKLSSPPLLLLAKAPLSLEMHQLASEAGADALLERECDPEAVADKIQALLSNHTSRSCVSPVIEPAGTLSLSDQNEALQRELAENQAKLHQLELHLRHAQRLSTIGTISSGVAHDFNNILCGILCLADLGLRSSKSYPDCYRNFQDIRMASNRASNLVRAIVSFSKRQEQPKGPFYPSEALMEGLIMLRATIPAFVEIAETILAPTARILGEISQFQQILTNLVINARHAIGNKGGRIEVRIDLCHPTPSHRQQHPSLGDKKYVCFQVIDDGSGISPEYLEHICEPFFTTKPPGQGTGLGLWVTRGIVESWDGVMLIDTKLNVGTTFSIYFPPAPHSATETLPPSMSITPHEMQILDAEDEPFANLPS